MSFESPLAQVRQLTLPEPPPSALGAARFDPPLPAPDAGLLGAPLSLRSSAQAGQLGERKDMALFKHMETFVFFREPSANGVPRFIQAAWAFTLSAYKAHGMRAHPPTHTHTCAYCMLACQPALAQLHQTIDEVVAEPFFESKVKQASIPHVRGGQEALSQH